MSAHDDGVSRGTGEQRAPAHDWEYQLQTDLYRCRRCGAEALKEAATWPGECVNVPDSQPEQEAAVISAAAAVAIARHVADDPRLSVAQRVAARDWCKERGLVLRTREECAATDAEIAALREQLAAAHREIVDLQLDVACMKLNRDDLQSELDSLRKEKADAVVSSVASAVGAGVHDSDPAHRERRVAGAGALLMRGPELEHRLGFGDAGRER